MENKTVNTALELGFSKLGNGVYKGKINSIYEEIKLLKSIVQDAKLNPKYRQLAVKIISSYPCQSHNYDCYVKAIYDWVKKNIKYIKDVTDYETLQAPDKTIAIGGGDCDDHAILVATLLESIGIRAKFKIVGWNGKYKHIYVIAITPEGKKWVIDTTLKKNGFYPLASDRTFEMEILESLEGMNRYGGKNMNLAKVKVYENGEYTIEPLGFDPSSITASLKTGVAVFESIKDIFGSKTPNPNINKSIVFSPEFVRAVSRGHKYAEVQLKRPAKDVMLIKQYSKSKCVKGKTFGLARDGKVLWVDKGCRGDFKVIPKPVISVPKITSPVTKNNNWILPVSLGLLGLVAFKKFF